MLEQMVLSDKIKMSNSSGGEFNMVDREVVYKIIERKQINLELFYFWIMHMMRIGIHYIFLL